MISCQSLLLWSLISLLHFHILSNLSLFIYSLSISLHSLTALFNHVFGPSLASFFVEPCRRARCGGWAHCKSNPVGCILWQWVRTQLSVQEQWRWNFYRCGTAGWWEEGEAIKIYIQIKGYGCGGCCSIFLINKSPSKPKAKMALVWSKSPFHITHSKITHQRAIALHAWL